MRILVTGATGFIGRALCGALRDAGFKLRIAVRRRDDEFIADYETVEIGNIGLCTDWREALAGVDVVVHLAGIAHTYVKARDVMSRLHEVNVFGTERLARKSAAAGVKEFIFISSVKVNGEGAARPYSENDLPAPCGAYAASKKEAEDSLAVVSAETGIKTVILRLPLVYGPGVKANFKNLLRAVSSGIPLPLGGVTNRRSFIYLGNLTDAIITCIKNPAAKGEVFMVSDGRDVSVCDLIKMIAHEMNKKPLLFAIPSGILRVLGKITGRYEEVDKLTAALLVDSAKIRNLLGWKPPFSVEEGIRETVKYYKL